jgi:predicted metal-dependent phosphoesterase TrpH/glycosyltransferase involved in cell wall biosynthesis
LSPSRLSIAHVTPHPWGPYNEVNEFVARTAAGLRERGHRVLIAAPSDSRAAIRSSRAAIREGIDDPRKLLDAEWARGNGGGDAAVLAVGQGIPLPQGAKPRIAPVPVDVSRSLERLLGGVPLDVVHVHDPFAPSASGAALRHSHSLNVGSFHEPTERLLSTQVARPLVEIFFGRLDARTVSWRATGDLMERYFPGPYDLVSPGGEVAGPQDAWWPGGNASAGGRDGDRAVRILYCAREERGALRLFLRALRRLPLDAQWEVVVWSDDEPEPLRLNRTLRERVRSAGPRDASPAALMVAADVVCAASGGPRPVPGLLRDAIANGAVPVASHLAVYEELTEYGELGLLFPPGDTITLAGQLERLIAEPTLRRRLHRRLSGASRGWDEVVGQVEDVYERVASRRHAPEGDPAIRRRLASRPEIHCDLHMHTDHSPDCATPVDVLLETARDRGLGAIAITDHNEISGALEAREVADGMDGIKVIVAEEVKTADEGEVIGLFLEEKIPRGMSMAETIAEIKRQGGLVYVPHPFDRFHTVPDYEHLLKIVEDIDIIEVFNPRIAFSAFNEEAERFAAKYRIVPGAGSDSHVAQGLGSVAIRLRDFEGPEEFLESMRDADIVQKHKNLIYVQALKFLQTTGRPKSARRARGAKPARPVKGGRRATRARSRASKK